MHHCIALHIYTHRSEGTPLRDMLSLGALGMGPGWPGKILPSSPPSPPPSPSPALALTELALTDLALIELLVFKKCRFVCPTNESGVD